MGCYQILQIIGSWDTLTLGSPQEFLSNWIRMIAERDLDRPLKTVDVPVVTSPLIGLVLLHERNKIFGFPTLGLEIIIIRS